MDSLPQASKLFNYYNLYRSTIALLLFGATFSFDLLETQYRFPDIHQFTTLAYFILNISFFFYYRIGGETGPRQIFFAAAMDIFLLHLLFYLGNGVTGGMSNLVIITVAASNIMIRGRIGMALAAFASLCSISVEIERLWASYSSLADLARAGLVGSIYFAAAYIVQNLSQRIRQSESLAIQQQQDILELQQLNHQIIQSMRTGIIVCDDQFRILTMNQACMDLIGLENNVPLPEPVTDRIRIWRDQPQMRTTPFRVGEDYPMVQANFSMLHQEAGARTLIFIDDTRLMTQQAQQLKLASLGRLTASIAHEVRNPLGAISHATQLLDESENIDAADRKMIDIIQRHCQRVNLIIENTLTLSRRAEPETSEIELATWLNQVIVDWKEHQKDLPEINLENTTGHARARFDPNQIEQVLINLLDNALRHGRQFAPDKSLQVKLAMTETGEQAFIDVINAGHPIPEEVTIHLFEPFFTTDSQGTGLGLYLSKEICEANQAQLDYIDSHTDGICFRIRFAHPKRII